MTTTRHIALAIASLAILVSAPASSGPQWAQNGLVSVCGLAARHQACQDWIATAKTPDTRTSCCGEADAYITDGFEVDAEGQIWAIITEEYPMRFHKGEKILIPKEKINNARDDGGNPSGHSVTWILNGTRTAICYFGPTGA